MTLACYGALEIVGVIIIVIISSPFSCCLWAVSVCNIIDVVCSSCSVVSLVVDSAGTPCLIGLWWCLPVCTQVLQCMVYLVTWRVVRQRVFFQHQKVS